MRLRTVLAVLLVAGSAAGAPPKKPSPKASATPAAVVTSSPALVVLETDTRPRSDYQAEVYSGVPLEDRYARERGVDKGLVLVVFEKQRRAAFRVPREKIRKRIRLAAPAPAAPPVIVASLGPTPASAAAARDHVDLLDTDDGLVVVDTTTTNAGIFTTSDVYVFPKGSTPEQRAAMLATVPPIPRERVRQALAAMR